MQKTVVVYVRSSVGGSLTPVTCDWYADLATAIAHAAIPTTYAGDVGALAASLRMTLGVDGGQVDVTFKTAGEAAVLVREHVVVEVSGLPSRTVLA